jgi:hypothetical protein
VKKSAYRILVRKPEEQRQFGRPMGIWDGNIKMDLQEIGWERADCFGLAHDKDK